MLLFSAAGGRLGQRIGPRIPMTVGPLVLAAGLVLLAGIDAGTTTSKSILPGVIVFGVGMTIFVAPLTAAVLGALPDERAGIASAVNNAAARLAQLLASAALPAAAGLSASTAVGPGAFSDGYRTAMLIAAAIAALGGLISWATIRGGRSGAASPPEPQPGLHVALPARSGRRTRPITIGRMSPVRPTVQLVGTRLDPARTACATSSPASPSRTSCVEAGSPEADALLDARGAAGVADAGADRRRRRARPASRSPRWPRPGGSRRRRRARTTTWRSSAPDPPDSPPPSTPHPTGCRPC